MILSIDFLDETNELQESDIAKIEELITFAASKESVEPESEVSITFVTNERIREINREYRDKDRPTDVISFAMEELGEGEIELVGADMPRILGDIIISTAKAKEQAEEYGHSFIRELGFWRSMASFIFLAMIMKTRKTRKNVFPPEGYTG